MLNVRKQPFSWRVLGLGAAVFAMLCGLLVVLLNFSGADTESFASRLGLVRWSEDNELRYQKLESCSTRIMCMMTFAEQQELEKLKKTRPQHVEKIMADNFGEIPNYFEADASSSDG